MNQRASVWNGMESVDATGTRLPRVADGMHVLKVVRCLVPRGQQQLAFVAEFEVIQSSNPSMVLGSQCSAYLSSKYQDSLFKQVKAFVAAACGYDLRVAEQDQVFSPASGVMTDAATSEHNALENRVVHCEGAASGKFDKKTGRPYFDYVWGPGNAPMPMPAAPAPAAYAPPTGYVAPAAARPAYAPPAAPQYAPQPGYAPPPAAAPQAAPGAPPGPPPGMQPVRDPVTGAWGWPR